MKLILLKLLARIFNSLPKTDLILLHWCHIYRSYGLIPPNLVGMDSAPTVSTDATPTSITTSSAVFDTNNISATGGQTPTVRGICWVSGAGGTPTTANDKTVENGTFGTGNFSATATGLTHSTTYSVRAYATNSVGTGYGSTVEVTTLTNTPPTVALNTPNDTATGVSTTPDLVFTGTDSQSDEIEYNVQVDTVNTFDSQVGAVIDSYSEANSDVASGFEKMGQSFTGNGNSIGKVKWYVASVSGSPSGNCYAAIYAHSGTFGTSSVPTGSALATSNSVDMSTISSGSLVSFTFATPYGTTNGTKYVVTLEFSSYDSGNTLSVGVDFTSPTHSGNRCHYSSGSWIASATQDYCFYVYDNASAPLLDKLSETPDATFSGTGDPHPWPSGNQITYTVQAGDELDASTQYYWRVRGKDPTGSNTYGSWATTRSFTTAGGGGVEVTPSQINATLSLPAPAVTAQTNTEQTPSQINATLSIPDPTVTAETSVNISADVVTATSSTQDPTTTTTANISLTPSQIDSTLSLPAPTTSGDASVAGDVVTTTASLPDPTVSLATNVTVNADVNSATATAIDPATSGDANVTADLTTATTSTQVPTTTGDSQITPDPVAGTLSLPTPSITVGDGASPAAVTATLSLPDPAITGDANKTADVVAGTLSLPEPTVSNATNIEVTPGVLTITSSTQEQTTSGDANPAPDPITSTVSTQAPSITVGDGASPAAVVATITLPDPVVTGGAQVGADVVASTSSLPAPTVTAGGTINVNADVVTITSSAQAASVSGDVQQAPDQIDATLSLPNPSISVGDGASPAQIDATLTLPAPTISTGTTASQSEVTITSSLPSPSVSVAESNTADVVTSTLSLPEPTITGDSQVAPDPVTATLSLPTPSVSVGGAINVSADLVTITASLPEPVVSDNTHVLVYDKFIGNDSDDVTNRTPDTINIPGNQWIDIAYSTDYNASAGGGVIQSNQLSLTNNQGGQAIVTGEKDAIVSVYWTPGVGVANRNAIVFRHSSNNNHFLFNFREDNGDWSVSKLVGSTTATAVIANTLYTFNEGQTYHMMVILNGNNMSFHIDGTEVGSAVDSDLNTNTAYGVLRHNGDNTTRFDDFTVRSLDDVLVASDVVTATSSLPAPSVTTSAIISPDVITITASTQDPSVSLGGGVTIPADVVTATASLPSPSISVGDGATPAPVTITLSLPAPTVSASAPETTFYNSFKVHSAIGNVDIENDTIKAALVTSGYAFNADTHEYFSDITNEVTGDGYTAGGNTILGIVVSIDTANDLAYADATDAVWDGLTTTFRGIVIYKDTGTPTTSPLICFMDYKSDQTADNDDTTLQWQSDGIMQLG